jgi:uncharacterized protein (TIGR03663 family)
MAATLTRWLLFALLAAGAGWLRTHDLARRPMHADEANQAVKAGELLETGKYAFDPHDHHGPTLYYATLPVAALRRQYSLAALDETTVRLVPALFGTFGVLLIALLAAPLGRWAAFAAGAFAAVAPAAVYYSRYFIQETLLLTFLLGAAICAARWWTSGKTRWLIGGGVCLGLGFATKASAPIFALAALISVAAIRPPRPASTRVGRDVGWALGAALLVAALLYSSFGTHFSGLRDALAAPIEAVHRVRGASGHEKPWSYYISLFTWQRAGGVVWQQLAFVALAVGGAIAAFVMRNRLVQAATVYTLLVGLMLSLTPYKTPWHVIHLVPGLCVLAAGALRSVARLPAGRLVASLFAAFALLLLTMQTRLAAFTYAADARNPLAYVHTSPDVLKARPLAAAALQQFPTLPVRVIGDEYWPLPWYLRGLPRVGYWATPPDDLASALIICSPDTAPAIAKRLGPGYRESFLGLRPGVICHVFVREP